MAQRRNDTVKTSYLYIAMELSNQKWKLGFSNGEKDRIITIEARDLDQFSAG